MSNSHDIEEYYKVAEELVLKAGKVLTNIYYNQCYDQFVKEVIELKNNFFRNFSENWFKKQSCF